MTDVPTTQLISEDDLSKPAPTEVVLHRHHILRDSAKISYQMTTYYSRERQSGSLPCGSHELKPMFTSGACSSKHHVFGGEEDSQKYALQVHQDHSLHGVC